MPSSLLDDILRPRPTKLDIASAFVGAFIGRILVGGSYAVGVILAARILGVHV